jgi:hypothetical protein
MNCSSKKFSGQDDVGKNGAINADLLSASQKEKGRENLSDARLVRFERGGHLLMVVEQATIRAAVQKHILDHDFPNC